MDDDRKQKMELIAEAAALRAAFSLLLEASQVFLANRDRSHRTELVQVLAGRLQDKRGDYLYSVPSGTPAELQAIGNKVFQASFNALCKEITFALSALD